LNQTAHAAAADAILAYARLFDTPRQAVIGTTVQGTIVYWSDGASHLYGWQEQDVLGMSIVDVTPADHSREEAEEIMTRLSRGQTWSGRFRVRRRDGSEIEVDVQDLPVRDTRGSLVGIVGVSSEARLHTA
jgi:PAS domain S-box-containing protein